MSGSKDLFLLRWDELRRDVFLEKFEGVFYFCFYFLFLKQDLKSWFPK